MRCAGVLAGLSGLIVCLSLGAKARAAQVSYSLPVSAQQIATTTGSTSNIDFTFHASLPQFNPSQGTLQQVQFNGGFQVRVFGDADTADLYLPCLASYNGQFATEPLLAQTQEITIASGPFDETDPLAYAGESITNPTILAAVTGTGNGDFSLFDDPNSSQMSVTVDAMGLAAAAPSGTAEVVSGSLSVTYTFTPEPGSLAVFACAGLLLLRQRGTRSRN